MLSISHTHNRQQTCPSTQLVTLTCVCTCTRTHTHTHTHTLTHTHTHTHTHTWPYLTPWPWCGHIPYILIFHVATYCWCTLCSQVKCLLCFIQHDYNSPSASLSVSSLDSSLTSESHNLQPHWVEVIWCVTSCRKGSSRLAEPLLNSFTVCQCQSLPLYLSVCVF